MKDILQYLEDTQVWIYLLLGLVGGVSLRKLYLAWEELRSAVFGLEREKAQRSLSISLTVVILLAMLAAAEYVLVNFISSEVPAGSSLATPTLDLLATPSPMVETSEALLVTEEAETQPTLTAPATEGCIPGEIEWLSPESGGEISGKVDLLGVINVANLGFFKYEFSQPGSDAWVTIAAGNADSLQIPEEETVKQFTGVWNTEQLALGDYLLRLVVTDNQNQLLPVCVIPVRVISP